jgi:adenylate cyclase
LSGQSEDAGEIERMWRKYLTIGEIEHERRYRALFRSLPGSPRCKVCFAPFKGAGSPVARLLFGKVPSKLNPHLCNICEEFARHHQGGADIELSLLFADVRGSTALAESMSPRDYSKLINRFYKVSSRIIIETDGLMDKIIGDQVAAMYVPGFAGPEHPRRAMRAARELLRATGQGQDGGPWIPLGAAVHTGVAFVGSVGEEGGTSDITVLGDAANTAARLASRAQAGEILVSESARQAAGMEFDPAQMRQLNLKGKSEQVTAYVLAMD